MARVEDHGPTAWGSRVFR